MALPWQRIEETQTYRQSVFGLFDETKTAGGASLPSKARELLRVLNNARRHRESDLYKFRVHFDASVKPNPGKP